MKTLSTPYRPSKMYPDLGYAQKLRDLIETGYSKKTYLSKYDYILIKISANRLQGTSLINDLLILETNMGHPQSLGFKFETTILQDVNLRDGIIKVDQELLPATYFGYKSETDQGVLATTDGQVIAL